MTPVAVEQTLHGYHFGHRLLAKSAALADGELALLDRLSDLSGHLPQGVDFDGYYTGFPCGRFYALGCTYPDRGARREGTVLTHTLLCPLEASHAFDLEDLARLHRRPESPRDLVPYEVSLRYLPRASRAPSRLSEKQLALAALYLGQARRPVLWQDPEPALPIAAQLARLLGPEARRSLSFCTFALQVRRLHGRPFDFLALPDGARGSFSEVSGLESWFVHGRLEHPAARALLGGAWVADLRDRGREWVAEREAFADRWRLPAPGVVDGPLLLRVEELARAARTRLPAARGLADLLHARFDLPACHPLWVAATDQILALLGDAPRGPRPLWEAADFLARDEVRRRAVESPEFAGRVAATLREHLVERAAAAAGGDVRELLRAAAAASPSWLDAALSVLPASALADAGEAAGGRSAP